MKLRTALKAVPVETLQRIAGFWGFAPPESDVAADKDRQ
jgi:hypothetical protein